MENIRNEHLASIASIDKELEYRGPKEREMYGFLTPEGWMASNTFSEAVTISDEYYGNDKVRAEEARYQIQKIYIKDERSENKGTSIEGASGASA